MVSWNRDDCTRLTVRLYQTWLINLIITKCAVVMLLFQIDWPVMGVMVVIRTVVMSAGQVDMRTGGMVVQ